VNTRFIAWLVGVDVSAVKAYEDVADWPTHWASKAQHRLSSLGISSQSEAMALFMCQKG
jgi:hypothetical protein